MEVADAMGVASLLRKHLVSDVGSDPLAEMVEMAADVDIFCDAGYGERIGDPVNSRNDHRGRRRDIRAGTITFETPTCGRVRICSPFSSPDAEPNKPRTSSCARPTWRGFHPQGG